MPWANWNAHVHMDGADAKWIGLGWGMADSRPGSPMDYFAEITVKAPAAANPLVGKVGPNESVTLIPRADGCGDDGIEIEVTYKVSSRGGEGQRVQINIAENAGQAPIPTGRVLKRAVGDIDEPITVQVSVPGSCPVVPIPAWSDDPSLT